MLGPAFLNCASPGDPALADMNQDSQVIRTIQDFMWNADENDSLFVATIANECDAVVTTLLTEYPGADLGTLASADYSASFVADPSGCTSLDLINLDKMEFEHMAPLLINSNDAAAPTKDALISSLVGHPQDGPT